MMGRNPYARLGNGLPQTAATVMALACALAPSLGSAQAVGQPAPGAVRPPRPEVLSPQSTSVTPPKAEPTPFDVNNDFSFEHETCDKAKIARCTKAMIFVSSTPSLEIPNLPVDATRPARPGPGSTVTYYVTATNNGPGSAIGVNLVERLRSGVSCTGSGPIRSVSGNAMPGGSFTIADLTGPGITLTKLDLGQSTTVSYSCQVN